MKGIIWIVLCLPMLLHAQGIQKVKVENAHQFLDNLSWEQVKQKAKNEGKYIFVDCMTTWCLPCKQMEEIYANQKVSAFLNKNFVSMKVQMDTSKKDNDRVKSMYEVAAVIQRKFNVTAFPSYLFFSPDGEIVHRDMGYKDVNSFINILENALDSKTQYYTLLSKYESGTLQLSDYFYLANTASALKEKALAERIARDYINQYLIKQPEAKLYTAGNITFIGTYVTSRDTEAFELFYKKAHVIDSVMKLEDVPGYSELVINWVISNEEIYPHLWRNNDKRNPVTSSPDWSRIFKAIKRKYSYSEAEKTVLNAKILWYESHKQWPALIQSEIKKIEKYGLDTTGTTAKFNLNNMVWYHFFRHSNDSSILLKAAHWMEILVMTDYLKSNELYPGWVDTYANVLYKAGRVKDALLWEQKAVQLAPDDKDLKEAYEKMTALLPTWGENN